LLLYAQARLHRARARRQTRPRRLAARRTDDSKHGRPLVPDAHSPYRTLDDKIEGVVVTFVDVTDRQEAEYNLDARERLLLYELSREVKNTLGVVQDVVARTLHDSGTPVEIQDTLLAQLQAVAKAHDQLVKGGWEGTDLSGLLQVQLEPYLAERVRLEGPQITLPTAAVTPFALLVHDLATNAAKYGALSTPTGEVGVTWELIEGAQGRQLRLLWA